MKRLLAILIVLCASCADNVTSIHLSVQMPPSTALDRLTLVVGGDHSDVAVANELRVLVPDGWADSTVRLELEGVTASQVVAYGAIEVIPKRGAEVDAAVVLADLTCATECTPGETRCEGDGIATCVVVDGCAVWGDAAACPTSTPFCSAGSCAATCIDECSTGSTTCDGTGAVRSCGNADSDTCLDWISTACASGEHCAAGACVADSACVPATCSAQVLTYGEIVGRMVANATYLYWITDTAIMRRSWSNGNVETFATGNWDHWTIVLDATHVYWLDHDGNIMRRAHAGGPIETFVPYTTGVLVSDIALSATHIYWGTIGDSKGVGRRTKSGGPIENVVTMPASGDIRDGVYELRLDDTNLYYRVWSATNQNDVIRTPIAGGASQVLVNHEFASAIEIDASDVYVMSNDLYRIPKLGGARTTIATTVSGTSFSVDDTDIIWEDHGAMQIRAKAGGPTSTFEVADDNSLMLLTPTTIAFSYGSQLKLAPRCACEP